MTLQLYSTRTVALDGRIVGRIDRDSYAMPSGEVRGQTVFYTGRPGAFDQPHRIGAPLYVPAVAGSASDWRINPDFGVAVRAALAGETAA
jgi:hypothetical protein